MSCVCMGVDVCWSVCVSIFFLVFTQLQRALHTNMFGKLTCLESLHRADYKEVFFDIFVYVQKKHSLDFENQQFSELKWQ